MRATGGSWLDVSGGSWGGDGVWSCLPGWVLVMVMSGSTDGLHSGLIWKMGGNRICLVKSQNRAWWIETVLNQCSHTSGKQKYLHPGVYCSRVPIPRVNRNTSTRDILQQGSHTSGKQKYFYLGVYCCRAVILRINRNTSTSRYTAAGLSYFG
jgi:hypothetical protein